MALPQSYQEPWGGDNSLSKVPPITPVTLSVRRSNEIDPASRPQVPETYLIRRADRLRRWRRSLFLSTSCRLFDVGVIDHDLLRGQLLGRGRAGGQRQSQPVLKVGGGHLDESRQILAGRIQGLGFARQRVGGVVVFA